MEYKSSEIFSNPSPVILEAWKEFIKILNEAKTIHEFEIRTGLKQVLFRKAELKKGYFHLRSEANPFQGYYKLSDRFNMVTIYNTAIGEFISNKNDKELNNHFVEVHNIGKDYFNTYYNSVDPTDRHIKKLHGLFMNDFKNTFKTMDFMTRTKEVFLKKYAYSNGILDGYSTYEKIHLDLFIKITDSAKRIDDLKEDWQDIFYEAKGFEFFEWLVKESGFIGEKKEVPLIEMSAIYWAFQNELNLIRGIDIVNQRTFKDFVCDKYYQLSKIKALNEINEKYFDQIYRYHDEFEKLRS